jgi:hypothetical protein
VVERRPADEFLENDVQLENHKLSPDQLLLDPNNYRFLDIGGYKTVSQRARYPEVGVQERALQLLQNTASFDLGALRDSILSNGFVPFEQIVVEKFEGDHDPPLYLVIEGNRRVAAVKTILRDNVAGAVNLSPERLATMQSLPVIEIIGTEEERKNYQKTLMAIRHVAGIREWGPYQQARLVVEMYDNEEHAFGPVAQRIGISAREVARRYRASKALQQMEDDDEFGEYAEPRLYSFFHEAVSQPKVREWLAFSDVTYRAEHVEARRLFYELLSPRSIDGASFPPKLQNANRQVRQLKDVVDKVVPLKILADPERSFEDAVRAADEENVEDETGVLEHSLAVALHGLRNPSIEAWLNPSERSLQLWSDLVDVVDKIREMMKSERGGDS